MGWYRASHFSCERISTRVAPARRPLWKMRSSNGGWHGLEWCGPEGWSLEGLLQAGPRLRADYGGNYLSSPGPSLVTSDLCLAELRSFPNLYYVKEFSFILVRKS